jgi:low affinity Fe/Cu permease
MPCGTGGREEAATSTSAESLQVAEVASSGNAMAKLCGSWCEVAARKATDWTGSSSALFLALGTILLWAITGPFFGYSDTWQLVINTGTTIITFVMVFLIQRAQNKDALALQLKLNEILAALQGASNRLINVEDLSESEVRELHQRYEKLAATARCNGELFAAHSVDEQAESARTLSDTRG